MKFAITINPTCRNEGECKLAKICTDVKPKNVGEYTPVAPIEDEVQGELLTAAGLRETKLKACVSAENPKHGRSIQLTYEQPTFRRIS
jgi:hypothetical protein